MSGWAQGPFWCRHFLLCRSVLILFKVISSLRFFFVNIFWRFVLVGVFSIGHYFPVVAFSFLMFCPGRHFFSLTFCLSQCFFHSTLCPIRRFFFWSYVLRCFFLSAFLTSTFCRLISWRIAWAQLDHDGTSLILLWLVCMWIVQPPYTGCAVCSVCVTLCSALSQASCLSPDDRRGVALPQEDVGEHVGLNHKQKVFRKGCTGDHSSQTPNGSGAPPRSFSRSRCCCCWKRQSAPKNVSPPLLSGSR